MKQQYKQKREEGFTIIEVMIVLAIAALILVVVLVAIPQLQRNQRNNARQSVASRVMAELSNYAGNNNGRYPADSTEIGGFNSRYLSDVDTTDPQTGEDMDVVWTTASGFIGTGGIPSGTAVGTFNYVHEHRCDGEALQAVAGNERQFALVTELEGGAIYCLDNR